MNQGLFRLVFNKRLGCYVPAHELATASAGTGRSQRVRRRALAALIASLSALGSVAALADIVPFGSSGLVPGSTAWSNAYVSGATPTITTIQQTAPQAIANWAQFNLAREHTLNINQQANWQMLHRIYDHNPSIIAGTINAAGTNYFVNTNGIIFANGAQINVGSLMALTAANMDDVLFTSGILSNLSGDPVFRNLGGFVKVEAGAAINAATGGRVMLLAKNVENSGVINTPDGQTILAAGEQVYLKSSTDPAGLIVEVDAGGTAANLGSIIADRGNVTLIGLAVNQQGRISASTSVRANGSVRLLARDTVIARPITGGYNYDPTRYGTVTIGENSVTEVRVETADKEEVLAGQALPPSRIEVEGRNINVQGLLRAKGGQVNITAKAGEEANQGVTTPVRVFLGDTSRIDVSGVDATAAMAKNQLTVQLFSDQLKDTPLLRGGALVGSRVYVDARKGTSLFDVAPLMALRTQSIAEKMSAGGTVNITSQGDVITQAGSVIDVSGGVIDYDAGFIRESKLLYNGRAIAISAADRNTPYQGLADVYKYTDPKWGWTDTIELNPNGKGTWQQAYREGRDAGTVNITSASPVVLDGALVAATRNDLTQRANLPDGGKFNLTIGGANTLRLQESTAALADAMTALSPNSNTETHVSTKMLGTGFNHLNINNLGAVEVESAITTAANGSVTLKGGGVNIHKDIVTPGGDITVSTQLTGQAINVADNVLLSTAGNWTNDTPAIAGSMQSPIALNGGKINLEATAALNLGQGSKLDASAGAWLDNAGTLHTGNGGDISLEGTEVNLGATLSSYGFQQGGKLSIVTGQDVQVGGQPGQANQFWLGESFFEQGGFLGYSVRNNNGGGSVTIGDVNGGPTVIHPKMQTLQIASGYASQRSGTSMDTVARKILLPEGLRTPSSLSFSAVPEEASQVGSLTVLANTILRTDAANINARVGAINLEASRQLTMLGSLFAPAGDITLALRGEVDQVPYDNQQSIWIGPNAVISATGQYVRSGNTVPHLLDAKVLNGGKITVEAEKGFVVVSEGSVMDVSGAAGEVDVLTVRNNTQRQMQYGAAGTIAITAREGMVLDGEMLGHASGTGEAGKLNIALSGDLNGQSQIPNPPTGARVLTVTTDKQVLANNLNPRDSLAAFEGKAQISTEQINRGGFDHVSLQSTTSGRDPNAAQVDRIVLQSGVNLTAPETLRLTSSAIEVSGNGEAQVNASYVALAAPDINNTVSTGDATFKVNANWIDLNGSVNLSGVKEVHLNSSQDIRGRSLTSDNVGSFRSNGDLYLTAGRIYPVTNNSFTFNALGNDSHIEVANSGAAFAPVYSAGGTLGLKANTINQNGTLLAPLGQINLDAVDKVTLGSGSLTSVSASGLSIPYGTTLQGGTIWNLPNGFATTNPAAKRISYSGKEVDLQSGSTIDISGGGDTFAYEWIQGIGGSTDVLSQAGNYAVIPGMKPGEYAMYDFDYNKSNAPEIGKSIWLSGVPGLPDGFYTLLPAHYALLNGAFLVQTQGSNSLRQGQVTQMTDGSSLVSGYLSNVNNSSRAAGWETFRVTNGNVFRSAPGTVSRAQSEFLLTSGNSYFAEKATTAGLAIPRLASDAGQLVLSASETLTLNVTLNTSKPSNGRGAMVDIVSDKINVVSDIGADDGTLQLRAADLGNMNADSILLGGTRVQGNESMEITTTASEVSFSNNAANALKVNQLISTANDSLTVKSGAVIEAVAGADQGTTRISVRGDGALLGVSGNSDLVFERSNTQNTRGVLDIQAGSQIKAARSLVLDATLSSDLSGNARVNDGGTVTLGASSILLGNPAASVAGMLVSNDLISSFGNLKGVTLNSHGNLNLYGPVDFGSDALNVTINAAGIVGHDLNSADSAQISANQLVLRNSTGASLEPGVPAASGKLDLQANSISIEGRNAAANSNVNAGKFALAGFEEVNLDAAKDLSFSGKGSLEIGAANTNISSGRITAATGTDYTVNASGNLQTMSNGHVAQTATSGLGAKLSLAAQTMTLGGNIDLASGQFSARTSQGDLKLDSTANINTASRTVKFDRFTAYTQGGVVSLQSDLADIEIASGARLDVSGGEGGNAGTVKLSASQGEVDIAAGTLYGQAVAGKTAGSLVLDSGSMSNFSSLNNALNQGGFNYSRDLRIRTGNVNIAAADQVQAQRFVLSADGGAISIAGKVDASGSQGGDIQIYARDDVHLQAGGQLLAKATASNGQGGSVLLSSTTGNVIADVFEADGVTRRADAALIDVSGSKRGDVSLRAERVGASGLKVDSAAPAAIVGADKILLESVKVTNVSATLNAATLNSIRNDTNAFYADVANTNANYAASADGITAIVAPHTELRVNGDATVANDWNLRDLSVGRDGVLTIRSSGNLQLNGSISDGFSTATTAGVLQSGESWSLNLVSGADLNAVNTMATIKNDAGGNMVLANNKLVRTGTGDINIATGGNLTLGNASSVIYTVGQAAASLPNFNNPLGTDGFGSVGTQYLTNGGDLAINAQGNITGALAAVSGTQQIVNNWLFRQGGGSVSKDVTWWLRTDLFQQGVAAFGGGNIAVKSGGDISNFSVSVPTTARYAANGQSVIDGGGNLSVNADGSIYNGMYFAGKGHMDLQAGGEIGRNLNLAGNPISFGTTLALQDATASVSATGGVYLETVFNPTLFAQSTTNASATGVANNTGRSAFFNTYSDAAAVAVSSLTGRVTFGLDNLANITSKLTGLATVASSQNSLTFYPGKVEATAFGGDIYTGRMKLMPNPAGELSLLAAGNIVADQIVMSDAERALIPSVTAPMQSPVNLDGTLINSHSAIPLHRNNNTPVAIVARDGSLTPWLTQTVSLVLPKEAVIAAGQDIRNLDANLQNMDGGDLTIVRAGRDIVYTSTAGGINLSGPGNLLVEAGRHLDLGQSAGINSLANTVNAGLPETGASVTVLAGVGEGANVEDYINLYIKPDGNGPAVLQGDAKELAAYRTATASALRDYMRGLTGNPALNEAQALNAFLALGEEQQAIFVYRHFSSELLASGRGYAESQSHARGDNAIASLWQGKDYQGDMSLFQSRIRTVRDGSIDVLAPGGMINVGVAGGSSSGNIGIVTEGGGDIRAFADTGFQVNQSRVITQYGSDITVWVNNGDIDAGRGSKTALSIPEVEISTDVYGNTTRRVKGAAAGSGIQAQTYDADGALGPQAAPKLGAVSLMAPRGVLNASEAGIVAGDFLAVATQVLGTNNISVGGTAVGVTFGNTASLASTNVGASSSASAATSAATDLSRLAPVQDFSPKNLMPSFVSVEILSLGNILR